MAMSTGGGGGTMSEINVTPLVDVMLVLLIIFMVAAPMLTTGVSVDLPQAHAPRIELNQEKLLLTIASNEKVYLGESEVPYARLEQALLSNARLQEEKEIYVNADREVRYGFVVQVLAIVRKAGIEKLGLVTDPLGGAE